MKGCETHHAEGCPLCDIFTKGKVRTKLYYPEMDKIQAEDDFVILECYSCKKPIVVATDHTVEIGKEQWGRILYRCKKLFGGTIRLKTKNRTITDHWHAHIEGITQDKYKLPDLRKKM